MKTAEKNDIYRRRPSTEREHGQFFVVVVARAPLCCVKHKSGRLTDQAKVDSVQKIALNINFLHLSESRAPALTILYSALLHAAASVSRNAISAMFCACTAVSVCGTCPRHGFDNVLGAAHCCSLLQIVCPLN